MAIFYKKEEIVLKNYINTKNIRTIRKNLVRKILHFFTVFKPKSDGYYLKNNVFVKTLECLRRIFVFTI